MISTDGDIIISTKYDNLVLMRQTEYHALIPTTYFVLFPDKSTTTISVPKWTDIEGTTEDAEALRAAEMMWTMALQNQTGGSNVL